MDGDEFHAIRLALLETWMDGDILQVRQNEGHIEFWWKDILENRGHGRIILWCILDVYVVRKWTRWRVECNGGFLNCRFWNFGFCYKISLRV